MFILVDMYSIKVLNRNLTSLCSDIEYFMTRQFDMVPWLKKTPVTTGTVGNCSLILSANT